jgi:hypothetical protein
MPDPHDLRIGDRIRCVRIPTGDLVDLRKRQRCGVPWAHDTVRILQRLADRRQVVAIDDVDEYGTPWFSYAFRNKTGRWEYHRLAVMDASSWEPCPASNSARIHA